MKRPIFSILLPAVALTLASGCSEADPTPSDTVACDDAACGAHGACNPGGDACTCDSGYAGADCSQCVTGYVAMGGNCVPSTCESDTECSDGDVCNGEETCSAHRCVPGQAVYCNTHAACDPNQGVCTCIAGYEGTDCASCSAGYVLVGVDCVAGECVNDADCADSNLCNGQETCGKSHVCEPAEAVDCGVHGSCTEATGTCVCDEGYLGPICETCAEDYADVEGTCLPAVTFEDLVPPAPGYWNGADLSGGFESGWGWFGNDHDGTTGAWSGFAYANLTETDHPAPPFDGYTAMAGSGAAGSTNYAVVYYSGLAVSPPTLSLIDCPTGCTLAGVYVTNVATAYYAMLEGSGSAKQFGGPSGTDPDWLKLIIQGITAEGTYTQPLYFYLADYQSDNAAEDYLLTDWTWVDLSPLGDVIGLEMLLSSSDTGPMGVNTPTYFALDNLTRLP